ncbi:hypothetical protein D9756_005650 [Leucocoprinus leucothites]|uniref:F-box domain-containing protein n=1 Tax=Leucocoprinus leucothites TaxID=201217 RepID=A0A8H5FYR7_9AGAR|nr:hypothetical protein D9756_005650 [Leucoagaricus leucothites]
MHVMASLLTLPDDLLFEIIALLPVAIVLRCKRVCHKFNQLTNDKHLWITIYHRTEHALRPTIADIGQITSPELQKIIIRAERLERIWVDEDALKTAPVWNRTHIPPSWPFPPQPMALMGEYVIFCQNNGEQSTKLQWIPLRTCRLEEPTVKEDSLLESSRNEPGGVCFEYLIGPQYLGYTYRIDHASHAVYLAYHAFSGWRSSTKTSQLSLYFACFEIDAEDGSCVRTEYEVPLLAGYPLAKSLTMDDRYVCLYRLNPQEETNNCVYLDIIDLRTKEVSQVCLVVPRLKFLRTLERKLYIFETYFVLVSLKDFAIFPRPSTNHPPAASTTASSLPRLHACFDGTLPTPIYDLLPCPSQTPSFVFINFSYRLNTGSRDQTTKIHLSFVEYSEAQWHISLEECMELPGTMRGRVVIPTVHGGKRSCYVLGATAFSTAGELWSLSRGQNIGWTGPSQAPRGGGRSYYTIHIDLPIEPPSKFDRNSTQVCRRLAQLTKARHVWIAVFNRTKHILRPSMDPNTKPLSELATTMAQAEELEEKFAGTDGVCASPPRAYRSENDNYWRRPLVVMREYVVVTMEGAPFGCAYQWLSRRNVSRSGGVVFEYKVPMHTRPHDNRQVTDYHLYHMDHDSNTFYVISQPDPYSSDENVRLAEIKLNGTDSRPYISACSNVAANPQRRPINYMIIRGHCVVVYSYNPDLEYETDINILDLRTKAVSQYRLVPPIPPVWENSFPSKEIYVSDMYILLIIDSGTHFCIFSRPNAEEEAKLAQVAPIPLQAVTHCSLPEGQPLWRSYQITHRTFPTNSFVIVGVEAGFPEDKTSKIQFVALENLGDDWDWVVKAMTKEVQGFHAGGTVFTMPSFQADHMLGVFSCRVVAKPQSGGRPKLRHINYQMLRVEGLGQKSGVTTTHLNLAKMDLAPWVDKKEDDLRFIDFDPFCGTALLVSDPAPEMGQGFSL